MGVIEEIRGGLVVSCQATPPNPLAGPGSMALMARAAELGGAVGIRANGPADIAAIKEATGLPVIGIHKLGRDVSPVYITPTFEAAAAVAAAGCDLIAVDGTLRPRPAESLSELIQRIHGELGLPVMADVDCLQAGVMAARAGADLVATTLSGYTGIETPDLPDIELVAGLVREVSCPVVAEGRYGSPQEVRLAFAAGAHAVVVGTAITNPMAITRRLVEAIKDR
ncbi:MAG TPA: N-acetylmannosamine-6-phosphate 2-epimerase [Candidatus Dormibacteraeota bacterium]|nr:N-acetylmannosamine-6-phosphate 2-epimerase [Candidatus Dormibacteraeota bacterium]